MTDMASSLRQWLDDRLFEMHVSMPARVERYDAATQQADVYPCIKGLREVFEGDFAPEANKIITSVPVLMLGGGGFRTTYPVAQGDFCLLVFSEVSLDAWLQKGGIDVHPGDVRRNDVSDAVALVGLHDFARPWSGASSSNMTLGAESGAQVVISPDNVHLGGPALTELVAIASRVENAINALGNAFATHVHAVSGAVTKPPDPPYLGHASGLGSQTVKVKP